MGELRVCLEETYELEQERKLFFVKASYEIGKERTSMGKVNMVNFLSICYLFKDAVYLIKLLSKQTPLSLMSC